MSEIGMENVEKEIKDIISEIVEVDSQEITREADFVNDLGMDSMQALEIVAAIEKKFKVIIPEDKLFQLKNLNEAIRLTEEYL